MEAFAILQQAVPDASLDVVGDGDPRYRRRLERLVADRRLQRVTFHGRVEEARKRELLAEARFHVFASRREGWGLTVSEAASVGTPTVGYDSPGVRDSIADARLLAAERSPHALAERMLALHRDPAGYEDARTAAWKRARSLDWGRTAEVFIGGGPVTEPLVSVILPTLNAERYLDECLGSLRAQDWPRDRLEIVMADGGSTDRTIEIAAAHGVDSVVAEPAPHGGGREGRGDPPCPRRADLLAGFGQRRGRLRLAAADDGALRGSRGGRGGGGPLRPAHRGPRDQPLARPHRRRGPAHALHG